MDNEKSLNENDLLEIEKLANEKYKTPEWNVLYNANYVFENTFLWQGKLTKISLKIKKGICETANSNLPTSIDFQGLTKNVPHETSTFQEILKTHFTEQEVVNFFF